LRAFRPPAPEPMPHASADSMAPAGVTASPEFPFIPDDREDVLINKGLPWSDSGTPGSSILLVGRSGTGKTSIAVARMWTIYKHTRTATWLGGTYNQIFVTANSVLRGQVRRSFQGTRTRARAQPHAHVPCIQALGLCGCQCVAIDERHDLLLQA
jgi:hypothetical protein